MEGEKVMAIDREPDSIAGKTPEQGTSRLSASHTGPRGEAAPAGVAPVRRRSSRTVFGWPLWEIARGPDPSRGETRGHARAIFATGDVADGVVAVGGISRGIISIGGVAFGLIALGGVSMSLLAAVGGVAIAPFAYGGAAVGGVSVGGAAVGVYAKGGAATGRYAMDRKEQDPEAVAFFRKVGLAREQPAP